jgi:integrase
MAKASTLETREQRARLRSRPEPYWRSVSRGVALGYRKGPVVSHWYVRRFAGGQYRKEVIGQADDGVPADGVNVLSWPQVLKKALSGEVQATLAAKSLTVNELLTLYWDHRRAKSRSDYSVATDEGKLRAHVVAKFGDDQVADLTTQDLARWRDALVGKVRREPDEPEDETAKREAKRRAQATADRIWRVFKAALNYGYNTGRVPTDNPWRKLKPFRGVDKPRDRFLSVDECRRLLNACPADFRALVRGAMLTGLRYGEITRLKVADYGDRVLLVPAGKPGTSRRLPLTSEGTEFFDQVTAGKAGTALVFTRADGEPWAMQDQKRRMIVACMAAKIEPRATFHTLRHTYGSLLVNSGGSLNVISKALGHADTRMTQRVYAHLQEDVMRKELEKALPRIGKRMRSNVKRLDRAKAAKRGVQS